MEHKQTPDWTQYLQKVEIYEEVLPNDVILKMESTAELPENWNIWKEIIGKNT